MAETGPGQLPKRYKSQRRQPPPAGDPPPSSPPVPSSQDSDGIVRSKSRYRPRPNNPTGSPPAFPQSFTRDDEASPLHPNLHQSALQSQYQAHTAKDKEPSWHADTVDYARQTGDEAPAQAGAQQYSKYETARSGQVNGAHQRLEHSPDQEKFAIQSSLQRPSASPRIPSGNLHTAKTPEDGLPRQDGPPQSSQIRATKSIAQFSIYGDEPDGGCFGLFKRKRGRAIPVHVDKTQISRPVIANPDDSGTRSAGVGIAPGTDAPRSAVNAGGDRQVLVECGRSRTIFPVTPSTSSVDVIKSAALCMSENISVKSAVLLEHFGTVGVQRPLRQYERIRDVMNSWDNDKQNCLLLVDPGTGSSEAELSVSGAPRTKPGDESWLLSYSQKVGKWDKRMITLKQDGQIICQKDYDKPKDIVNVCHLSDFDIYTPTPDKIKKKIKPPKKHCFAIKSQQKTAMFESTHNFVHFFSTADRATADSFYQAVQGWRSWYLINVMGEGGKPKADQGQSSARKPMGTNGHRPQESVGSEYQLGSFRPMFGANHFEQPQSSGSQAGRPSSSGGIVQPTSRFRDTTSSERKNESDQRQHPPLSMHTRPQLADDEPLGNLARSGSARQRRASYDQPRPSFQEIERDQANTSRQSSAKRSRVVNGTHTQEEYLPDARQSPHTTQSPRKTAANTGELRHSPSTVREKLSTVSGRGGSIDLKRSSSRREPVKPLIDLTPQHRELPQHSKKGKGYHPETIGNGGLIENATSPDDPFNVPPSTDWRRKNEYNTPSGETDATPHVARARSTKQHFNPRSVEGFTGEGLLASTQVKQAWGGGNQGRGVIDGSRAGGKPMLDVSADIQFTQGSLLNRVDRGL